MLDLNGLLVHRVFLGDAYANADAAGAVPRVSSTWHVNNFLVYERPHVRDFLRLVCRGVGRGGGVCATLFTHSPTHTYRFCLDNFFVGVWTTASANNATPLLEGLLPPVSSPRLAMHGHI